MKHQKKLCLLLAFCLLWSGLLCGCRPSPALEEIVYLQQEPEPEPETEMLDPEDEGEPDEEFEEEPLDEAETERDTEEALGSEDPNQQAQSAARPEYESDADRDLEGAEQLPEEAVPEESQDPAEPEAGPEPEEPEQEAAPIVAPAVKQVVDASGRTVELPDTVGTVTAVGAAAQMVEMLGGPGRLAGTNAALKSNAFAQAAFSDLAHAAAWWNGEGASPCIDMDSLLAAHPDVCFELSGQGTFSSDQIQQLEDAGIPYVVLPALSSRENLKSAVSLVAQVMGSHTDGRSSLTIASSYSAWVDSMVSKASGGSPFSCLYVAAWDSTISYTLDEVLGDRALGSGLAVAYSPAKTQLLSAFWKLAGVTNESTRLMNRHGDRLGIYVAPMFHQFDPIIVSDQAMYFGGAECAVSHDLFLTYENGSASYALGNTSYPAIVAADLATAEALRNDWFWKYHPTDEQGYVIVNGMQFYSGVAAPYRICIQPQGMVSWAEGSLETPLESYWISACLNNPGELSAVQNAAVEFYARFFGCDISGLLGQMFPAELESLTE